MLSVIWAKKYVITLIRINRPLFGVSEILKFFLQNTIFRVLAPVSKKKMKTKGIEVRIRVRSEASSFLQCFGSGSFYPDPTFFPESGSAKKSGSDPENPDPRKTCLKNISTSKQKLYIVFSFLNTLRFGQVPPKSNQRKSFRSRQFVKAKTGRILIRVYKNPDRRKNPDSSRSKT